MCHMFGLAFCAATFHIPSDAKGDNTHHANAPRSNQAPPSEPHDGPHGTQNAPRRTPRKRHRTKNARSEPKTRAQEASRGRDFRPKPAKQTLRHDTTRAEPSQGFLSRRATRRSVHGADRSSRSRHAMRQGTRGAERKPPDAGARYAKPRAGWGSCVGPANLAQRTALANICAKPTGGTGCETCCFELYPLCCSP